MNIWQSILSLILTSLLVSLAIFILFVLLKLFHFTETGLYEIILSRSKITRFFLILLIFLGPIVLIPLKTLDNLPYLETNLALQQKIIAMPEEHYWSSEKILTSLLLVTTCFPRSLGLYMKELLISMVIVVSFVTSLSFAQRKFHAPRFIHNGAKLSADKAQRHRSGGTADTYQDHG